MNPDGLAAKLYEPSRAPVRGQPNSVYQAISLSYTLPREALGRDLMTLTTTEQKIARLIDRSETIDLIGKHAYGMDSRDWEHCHSI